MVIYKSIGIRPIEADDLPAVRKLRNDQSTFLELTDPRMVNEWQQVKWFESMSNDPSRAYYAVYEVVRDESHPVLTTGDFIGIVRTTEIDRVNRSVCLGADVVPEKRSRGFGAMIYEAMLDYLFRDQGFHRVWLLVLDENQTGRRLYERQGFVVEGVQRQAIWRRGGWADYVMMSILDSEWLGRRK